MYPILISIGPFHLASSSVFLILAWCFFSFTFWRLMREYAVEEEKTFDLMFYGSLLAILGARAFYVLFSPQEFTGDWLRILTMWVTPGLSFYGGLFVGLSAMLLLAKRKRVRMGAILDAVAPALGSAIIVGKIGSFLGAAEVGIRSNLPIATMYAGYADLRHPVQLYEIGVLLVMLIGAMVLERKARRRRWAFGLVGSIFFLVYAASMFALEFLKDGGLYWRELRLNQWILLALFCESAGALYVRGGGRAYLRLVGRAIGGWYGRISKRHTS